MSREQPDWVYRRLNELAETLEGEGATDPAKIDEFGSLLDRFSVDEEKIAIQEHRVFLHRLRGEVDREVHHREREIELLRRSLEIGGPVAHIDETYLGFRVIELVEVLEFAGHRERADYWRGMLGRGDAGRGAPGPVPDA